MGEFGRVCLFRFWEDKRPLCQGFLREATTVQLEKIYTQPHQQLVYVVISVS